MERKYKDVCYVALVCNSQSLAVGVPVNPHTTKQTPQANHQPSTASSNLRARRDTLALAPALAERLTKDRWKVAPEKAMGKKDDDGGSDRV